MDVRVCVDDGVAGAFRRPINQEAVESSRREGGRRVAFDHLASGPLALRAGESAAGEIDPRRRASRHDGRPCYRAGMASGREDDPESVVMRFNEGINGRDLDVLAGLMTDDHVFMDSVGGRVEGRQRLAAWRGFFGAYPDYRNEFASMTLVSSGMVAVTGRSVCSEPALDGPALWTARIRESRLCEWRVYEDTPGTRAWIGL